MSFCVNGNLWFFGRTSVSAQRSACKSFKRISSSIILLQRLSQFVYMQRSPSSFIGNRDLALVEEPCKAFETLAVRAVPVPDWYKAVVGFVGLDLKLDWWLGFD